MTPLDPKPAHFLAEDMPDGLRLSVSVPRTLPALLLTPAWIVVWAVALVLGVRMGLHGQGSMALFAWLVAWACCGAMTAYHWLWMIAGREIVTLRPGHVQLRRDILGLGRSRSFPSKQMTDLHYVPEIGSLWRLAAKRPSCLAFQYGKCKVEFARGVDDVEAMQMIRLIRQHTSGLQMVRAAGAGD